MVQVSSSELIQHPPSAPSCTSASTNSYPRAYSWLALPVLIRQEGGRAPVTRHLHIAEDAQEHFLEYIRVCAASPPLALLWSTKNRRHGRHRQAAVAPRPPKLHQRQHDGNTSTSTCMSSLRAGAGVGVSASARFCYFSSHGISNLKSRVSATDRSRVSVVVTENFRNDSTPV